MALSNSAILNIFKRSGAPGPHTTYFEAALPMVRETIAKFIERNGVTILPVIVTFFSTNDWSAIAADGILICSGDGSARIIQVNEINDVLPVQKDGTKLISKKDYDTLHLSLRDGTELHIRTDPGSAFMGIWNVLKSLEAQSKSGRA